MKLSELVLIRCLELQDLEPFKGMPLTSLWVDRTLVLDLEPLKGMPVVQRVFAAVFEQSRWAWMIGNRRFTAMLRWREPVLWQIDVAECVV